MSGKAKVFTDGSAGTTGLKIVSRLRERDDVELITLSDDKRKDTEERRKAINAADIAFLCLPDDAAREAVSMSDGSTVNYRHVNGSQNRRKICIRFCRTFGKASR